MLQPVIRIENERLETPLVEFHNPLTGSNIGVVGMIHVAKRPYYKFISDYTAIQQERGATVHFERVRLSNAEELGLVEPEISQSVRRFRAAITRVPEVMAVSLNLTSQREGIDYQPEWQNHDSSDLELVSMLGHSAVNRVAAINRVVSMLDCVVPLQYKRRALNLGFQLLSQIDLEQAKKTKAKQHFDSVVIDHRNNIALAAVEKLLTDQPDSNIVMLWGSAHLPGIGAGLQKLGYAATRRFWLPAFSTANVIKS